MYHIIIQLTCDKTLVPQKSLLRKWAQFALQRKRDAGEITIRIVDSEEMSVLNSTYRKKTGPTNVLSFPFDIPEGVVLDVPILGDIVICAEVVNDEAISQGKNQDAHWAHMIIHGVFHLLGYDHEMDSDAIIMESLEIETLQHLGFANPYDTGEAIKHHD